MPEPITIGSLLAGAGKIFGTGILTGAGAEVGKGVVQKVSSALDNKPLSHDSILELAKLCKDAGGRFEYKKYEDIEVATCTLDLTNSEWL